MKQNETNLGEMLTNVAKKYYCESCDYKCCVKFSYERHLVTSKHMKRVQMKQNETKKEEKYEKDEKEKPTQHNICVCGIVFNSRTTLWRHKKTCITIEKSYNEQNIDKKDELLNYLMKENQEFKNLILEIVKKDNITNNNNITHTNSHNKSFNLNFFLNETCKNAMNITDFVDSIKLQLSDLESVAKIGYVEGLSKIIIKNLNALDVTERPVHCSDSKRDTMYVKDEDKWEKESEDNHKVLKAIEDIANKNSKMVKEWKTKNPECASSKSHKADVYSHIMIQAVCSNNDMNNSKILKKIAKEVIIDKS